jgi:ABC-type multidrug transport system permease subunit
MRGIFKVLAKDAAELLASPRMLVLSFVVPPVILLLVGQLNLHPPALKVWMSGLADCEALRGYGAVPAAGEAKDDFGAGFLPLTLTPEQSLSLGAGGNPGVIVVTVEPGSAAQTAALQGGDMIVAANGSAIARPEDFEKAIGGAKAGDKIALTVIRAGQQQALEARIASAEPPELAVFRYLRELSYVKLTCWPNAERDPFASLAGEDVDLLLNIEDAKKGRWAIYVKETNPGRVAWLLELAQGIRLAQATGVPVQYKLSALGALPLRPALLYHPQSADKSLALLPMTFSLIVCFLAFIVAAPSLIRERELHTLEILLGAPGIGGRTILVGKALLPIVVSLFAGTFMLVVVQAVYGLYVKADVALFLLFLVLPILSSTLLGLLVSALARSQVQTVMASAIYFFCLLLLSGFLYPTDAGAAGIQLITRAFGLTYLLDPANAWFFGADPFSNLPLTPLILQCLVYAALAGIAWRRQLRQI